MLTLKNSSSLLQIQSISAVFPFNHIVCEQLHHFVVLLVFFTTSIDTFRTMRALFAGLLPFARSIALPVVPRDQVHNEVIRHIRAAHLFTTKTNSRG